MPRRVAAWSLLACLGGLAGCFDFEQFRVPLDLLDASADRGPVPADDLGAAPDAGLDAGPDAGPPADAAPACDPGPEARIRLAHMASGFGPVQLCMRRNTLEYPYAAVGDVLWPAGGLPYLDVSPHLATNTRVTQANESWQFAVVPAGAECSALSVATTPLAEVSVRLTPRSHGTVLFTSQLSVEGGLVGALSYLPDRVCPACPVGSVDVRAVHASLSASVDRLSFAISYATPPDFSVPAVNVLFANNVPYGGTAFTGGEGFDCDAAWWSAALLPDDYTVHFSVRALGGGEVARSVPYALQSEALRRSRVATLFFAGDAAGVGTSADYAQRFVLCYEGDPQQGALGCVPIPVVPRTPDAGLAPDAGPAPDASLPPDAPAAEDAAPDADAPPDADDRPDADDPSDAGTPWDVTADSAAAPDDAS